MSRKRPRNRAAIAISVLVESKLADAFKLQ